MTALGLTVLILAVTTRDAATPSGSSERVFSAPEVIEAFAEHADIVLAENRASPSGELVPPDRTLYSELGDFLIFVLLDLDEARRAGWVSDDQTLHWKRAEAWELQPRPRWYVTRSVQNVRVTWWNTERRLDHRWERLNRAMDALQRDATAP